MANAIVVIVVIIIMLFAGKGAYKHLKGEGACCEAAASRRSRRRSWMEPSWVRKP